MKQITVLAIAVVLIARYAGIVAAEQCLFEAIAFTSTRDNLLITPPINAGEIYLMNPDGTNPRRLTENTDGDGFAKLSPDGKKIVFDSNRARAAGEPVNTSDLFLMNTDGTEQTFLTRGSSATWSPDSKHITFHRSASGDPCPVSVPPGLPGIPGCPIKADPGAATWDSDIFVVNVDDLLNGAASPQNITNNPAAIDDDPDWSPDGQKIVFTSHLVSDNPNNSTTAEIYVINVDGTGLMRLTFNAEEERAPAWSPNGTRIAYLCKAGGADFEICVMNADGTGQTQLTNNTVLDATPTWSLDGQQILFHRNVAGLPQLFVMNADGTGQTQLTSTPGLNFLAAWGVARAHCAKGDTGVEHLRGRTPRLR